MILKVRPDRIARRSIQIMIVLLLLLLLRQLLQFLGLI